MVSKLIPLASNDLHPDPEINGVVLGIYDQLFHTCYVLSTLNLGRVIDFLKLWKDGGSSVFELIEGGPKC